MGNEEKILAMLAEMQAEIGKRFDKLETTQAEMQTTLAEHGEQLTKLTENVDKLDKRVVALDEQVVKLDERVVELDARSLKSAVLLETDVARDIHLVYEGHAELKRKMDTLATKGQMEKLSSEVDVIKKVVSGHTRDIGRLKKAQ